MNTVKTLALVLIAAATVGTQVQAEAPKSAPRLSPQFAMGPLLRPIVMAAFNQVVITNPNRVSINVTYQVTILNSDATTTITTKTASVGPLCTFNDSYQGQNLLMASLQDYQAE